MIQPFSIVNPEPSGKLSKKQIADYVEGLRGFITDQECTKNLSDDTMLELHDELRIWEERLEFANKIEPFHQIKKP